MDLEKRVIESFKKFEKEVFDLNYSLANHPEISGKEYESVKKIVALLNHHGIQAKSNFCDIETAFFGKVIERKDSNINIAILTEYDALPDIGHGCGHSASAAISVLAALALKDNEELIDVNIDIIGTPDEENEGLKIPMADKGIFDKYDCAIMVHLYTQNVPNWRFLAFETYEFEFTGKPSHAAATPWEGRSALDGLMLSIHGFDMMRKNMKPQTIIEGFIKEGGVATNIIPEKAVGKYTFRSNSTDYIQKEIYPWVVDMVEGCAKATQTKVQIHPFGYPFKDMKFNHTGTDLIKDVMADYGMPYEEQTTAAGSSDMGNVSYCCPAFHPSVAIVYEDVSLHTKEFADLVKSEKSEDCIRRGATIIDGFLTRLIVDPDKLEAIVREFKDN